MDFYISSALHFFVLFNSVISDYLVIKALMLFCVFFFVAALNST